MRLKNILSTICFVLLFTLPSFGNVSANAVFPYKKEVIISNQERTKETVSFRNDSKKDVFISPQVYSYNPQTLEITDTQSYIFTRVDMEIFKVKPGETLSLNYEIIPPANISPGTYFNLIVLQKKEDDVFLQQTNPIGVMDNLSHLVVLHIIESDAAVYGITSEFAQITLQVVENGIPFVRPTRIKYIYQNTTNYVLSPEGEIQLFNRKGAYSPIYLKINEEEKKLYPGGIIEEEFEIDKYDITDLFNSRTIIGRFYNGIDENFILKETNLDPNYSILLVSLIFFLSIILLIKAVIQDRKTSKK